MNENRGNIHVYVPLKRTPKVLDCHGRRLVLSLTKKYGDIRSGV